MKNHTHPSSLNPSTSLVNASSFSRDPRTWSAWLFFALVLVTYATLFIEQFRLGLEYDESYIISVVRNIAIGNGFVGDGISFYSNSQLFDPQISSGPTLLLPGVLVWWLSNGSISGLRIVPIIYFVVFLLSLNLLFNRKGDPWIRAAVVASPLLMTVGILDLTTRSLVPGRFLGEIAALSCLTLGAAVMARGKLLFGGLIAGFSITAKLHFVVPVATLLVTMAVVFLIQQRFRSLTQLALAGLIALTPLALFEFSKIVILGFSGYADHLSIVRAWAETQSRSTSELIERISFRLDLLMSLLSGWVLFWLGVGLLLSLALLPWVRRTVRVAFNEIPTERMGSILGYVLSSFTLLVWWLLASVQDSPRQAIPTVLIWLSLIAAVTSHAALKLRKVTDPQFVTARLLPVLMIVAAFATVISQGARIFANDSGYQLALQQKEAASLIESNGEWWVPRDGFWTNPEYLLLTGLDSEPVTGASGLKLWSSVRALTEAGVPDARIVAENCSEVLQSTTHAVVCRESPPTAPFPVPISLGAADFIAQPEIFTAGWNPPEPWGVWSSGERAFLTIPVDTRSSKGLSVAISGRPFGREGQVARVSVKADGKSVGTWLLPANTQPAPPFRLEFDVAVPVDRGAWTLDFEIQTPDAVTPKDAGIPVDMGELGFGLTHIDVASRSQ